MAKQWDPAEAAQATRAIYRRVLEREPDDSGLIVHSSILNHGELSVREVVLAIGKSDEYRNRMVVPLTLRDAAKAMYRHFLAREAESETAVDGHAGVIAAAGFRAAVDGFLESEEYRNRFGEDTVPA